MKNASELNFFPTESIKIRIQILNAKAARSYWYGCWLCTAGLNIGEIHFQIEKIKKQTNC